MTRGRRKDITLPPSRAIIIQRAYRDKKARYLAELEDRCRKAEEENERLRKELELARSESAVACINIEMARACSDLMQNLERTQKVLSLFQERTLNAPREAPQSEKRTVPSAKELDIAAILTRALGRDPSTATSHQQRPGEAYDGVESPLRLSANEDDSSECCEGLIDCNGLIE